MNSKRLQETMEKIDNLMYKCEEIKIKISSNTTRSNDSLKQALKEIEKYREDINKRVDELETEIKKQIQTLQEQNDDQIKEVETVCSDIQMTISSTSENLKQQNNSNLANQLFQDLHKAQELLKEFEDKINSTGNQMNNKIFKFKLSPQIDYLLKKEEKMGEILAEMWLHPIMKKEISVKASSDDVTCCITGMTMLSSDKLLLSDHWNNTVKLVDINSRTVLSQLSLGSMYEDSPYDITAVSDTVVAVTIPRRQKIQFVSVADDITMSYSIQTNGDCYGICRYEDKLIVAYRFSGKLEILDINDNMKENTPFSRCILMKNRCQTPFNVQANKTSIYVSFSGSISTSGSIIMFNWEGDVIARCTDMVLPRGLALNTDGSLLVCDFGEYRLYQISGSCVIKNVILQDVSGPGAICVDRQQNKLYVSTCKWLGLSMPMNDWDDEQNNILTWNI